MIWLDFKRSVKAAGSLFLLPHLLQCDTQIVVCARVLVVACSPGVFVSHSDYRASRVRAQVSARAI